jgi:hypothetical protein
VELGHGVVVLALKGGRLNVFVCLGGLVLQLVVHGMVVT